jgi:hypothetical protein
MDLIYQLVDDWLIDDYYGMDYVLEELRKDIANKFEISEDEAEEILDQFDDEIKDTIYDRDKSTPVSDLLKNTGSQTMFYDTGYEIGPDSWSWSEAQIRLERMKIKNYLGIIGDNDNHNIDMMIREASYGGQLVVYFYDDVEDYIEAKKKSIRFSNAYLAIINTGNGSGDHTRVQYPFTLPFEKQRIHLCKTIKYSYTFEVCGMYSSWCDGTGVTFVDEQTKELETSQLANTLQRDAEYKKIFQSGKCSLGDMDIRRHRHTVYVNDFPCGRHCLDCGTFWID